MNANFADEEKKKADDAAEEENFYKCAGDKKTLDLEGFKVFNNLEHDRNWALYPAGYLAKPTPER